ncbi:hypothetical protein ACFQS6_17705 [Xanthomonas populi]
MLQVAEAREAQKRAEDQLTKAVQRGERLASELESLRAEVVTRTTQLQRATQDCVAAADHSARLQAERDELTVRLATTGGRLEAATQQAAELMARVGSPLADTKAATTGKNAQGRQLESRPAGADIGFGECSAILTDRCPARSHMADFTFLGVGQN